MIFDFSGATFVDDSAAMLVEQLIEVAERSSTHVIVIGLKGRVAETLNGLDILRRVPADHVVGTLDEARDIAISLLGIDAPPAGRG